MKRLMKIALVAVAMVIVTGSAVAQEWTKAQSEVWQVVEDSWVKWKAGDLDAFKAYLHDQYQGWSSTQPLPLTKVAIMKSYSEAKEVMVVDGYTLNPARIAVVDDAAVVDYFFTYSATVTKGGKKESESGKGKNVEFWVREGGKWLLLGDMTVFDEAEDDD